MSSRGQDSGPPSTSGQATVPSMNKDENAALREAGRDYFNKMLSKTTDGSKSAKQTRRKREKVDADLEAFGAAIEGSKLYIALGVQQASRALGVFLLKVRVALITATACGAGEDSHPGQGLHHALASSPRTY